LSHGRSLFNHRLYCFFSSEAIPYK